MPRRSSRKRSSAVASGAELSPSPRSRRHLKHDSEEEVDVDEVPAPIKNRKSFKGSGNDQDSDNEDSLPPKQRHTQHDSDEESDDDLPHDFGFSQQAPEASQGLVSERPNERRNLERMDKASREKAITSLSRLVLFRALEKEPLDRLKLIKEAGLDGERITTAAFQEVASRLRNVFGFELSRIPKYMDDVKGLPSKFKDRLYVLNGVSENTDGMHSKAIHSRHQDAAIEKGLLILVLALIFCKGESRPDRSRWLLARDLYRLLHGVDEGIPEEPPSQGTTRAKAGTQSQKSRLSQSGSLTPNVDYLLEQFVSWEYLLKEKATEENFPSQTLEEGDFLFSMGPRSALEVGRRQVIFFCAEILDEEPDPTMLKEIEDGLEEEQCDDEIFMEEAL